MKAWYLEIKDSDEGSYVVFANTRNEARAQADSKDLFYDSWIEITARRFKAMDDKEHLDDAHLALDLWRNHGWRYLDLDTPEAEDTTDEEFLKWYEENLGR